MKLTKNLECKHFILYAIIVLSSRAYDRDDSITDSDSILQSVDLDSVHDNLKDAPSSDSDDDIIEDGPKIRRSILNLGNKSTKRVSDSSVLEESQEIKIEDLQDSEKASDTDSNYSFDSDTLTPEEPYTSEYLDLKKSPVSADNQHFDDFSDLMEKFSIKRIRTARCKELLQSYLNSSSNIFNQAEYEGLTAEPSASLASKRLAKDFLITPEERLSGEREINSFLSRFVFDLTSAVKPIFNCTAGYIQRNIYAEKARHFKNSFFFYHINVDKVRINQLDGKSERMASPDEILKMQEQAKNDLEAINTINKSRINNFEITDSSLNTLDATQLFQIKVVFGIFKDAILLNKSCSSNLHLGKFLDLLECLENMVSDSCCRSQPTKGHAEPGSNLSASGYLINDRITSIDKAILVRNPLESNKFFIYFIQYLSTFVEKKLTIDSSIPKCAPRLFLLKFAKIAAIVYESLIGTNIVSQIPSYHPTDQKTIELLNSSKVKELSVRLENELLEFIHIYRRVYRSLYQKYKDFYSPSSMKAVHDFNIAVTILDTIMWLMNLFCNFRNVLLDQPLKTYYLNTEFIESMGNAKFEKIQEPSGILRFFIAQDYYRNTGIQPGDSSLSQVFTKIAEQLAFLIQLPVSFCKNKPADFAIEFDENSFKKLLAEYNSLITQKDGVLRPKNFEYVLQAVLFISQGCQLPSDMITIGQPIWIEVMAKALSEYVRDLNILKTGRELGFGLDKIKPM